ncbi:MAG TPA: ATP-binding cassette domain-containing protein, partial [Anaerolineae bacterium]|nr:ATP-binding cassette domain-containing protein [Anaerolineae bacterium]
MIELRDVTYSYPETEAPVLRDLSLNISEGEFLLVIGASGSGKSTLLRCLNGLVPHFYGGRFRGSIRVAGRDPLARGPRGMSSAVGFVLQDPESQFVVDSVEDELAFAMENHNLEPALMRKRIEEALDQISIAHLRHRKISTLSGGEKQRVAIGAVLTLQPKILVLDEPTSQLDPQAAEEVLTTLQKLNTDLGLTIVLSEHRLERVVQYADRVLYLPGPGQDPLLGSPRDVLAQVDLMPPLVRLARELQWEPLPLTIKEGRRFAKSLNLPTTVSDVRNGDQRRRRPGHDSVIEVRDVWFSYNGHEALKGINLSVGPGELVALMGRNGSGKTTLLKHLVGLLRPDRGHVDLWGESTKCQEVQTIARRVGYVPQDPGSLLFADTLRAELDFTLRSHKLPTTGYQDVLESLHLSPFIESYPRDLSGGERQRAALAAILVADPDVILLDEPTRGLDYYQKQSLSDFLSQKRAAGKAVIMSTHDVELVARCADRVVILGEGQVVVDGPAREVMSNSMVFASQVNKLF